MPKQELSFALINIDKEMALAISYQALKDLGWDVLFAGEDKILGQTIKKWNANPQHVVIASTGSEIIVSSEMIKNEMFDITGKNKKNIAIFFAAFETAKNGISPNSIEANKAAINELRSATLLAADQEQKDAAEIDNAMNLSGSNMYVTYAIIAVNVFVFILMAIKGAGIFEPNGLVHIKWGSDYAPLTLSGDWWRLITSVFIHFGIIHLLMNMYSLYTIGIYLEPMLGKVKYTVAYLCTGVLASIVSLWWHTEPVNSAGASGAIFGMYGLFLALLTTNLIPKKVRQALLQSIGIFIVYNLIYGVKGGVDNAAHVGGLLSGFFIGYIYVFSIKKEKVQQKVQWVIPAVIVLTLAVSYGYLKQNKMDKAVRRVILNEVEAVEYKDSEKFNKKIEEFANYEEKALNAIKVTDSISRAEYAEQIIRAIPFWDNAATVLKATSAYKISEVSHKKADKLLEYIQLRKEEFGYLAELNNLATDDEAIKKNLYETQKKLEIIIEELKLL